MSVPKSKTGVLTMKRFRLRLSTLLWLVAITAAFLGGFRYGELRAATRPVWNVSNVVLSPAQAAKVNVIVSEKSP